MPTILKEIHVQLLYFLSLSHSSSSYFLKHLPLTMTASTDTENTEENPNKQIPASSVSDELCSFRLMQQINAPQGAIPAESKNPDLELASVSEMNTDERDFRKKQVLSAVSYTVSLPRANEISAGLQRLVACMVSHPPNQDQF
jgi:hypothetical protein